jgi:tetratricopeptide (TPR) repeat protein
MQNLKELVEVVTANKVKKIEVIGNPNDKGTKMQKLYDAIRQGDVNTDEDAFALLYSEEGSRGAFHKLKHTLKDRLINTLFFIDTKSNKYSDIQQAYFLCAKEVIAIEILSMRMAMTVACRMAEKLLPTTLMYDFTQLNIALCGKLASYFAQALGDRNKFIFYNNLLLELSRLHIKEALAEARYWDIVSYYVRDKSTKKFIAPIAEQYINEIETLPSVRTSRRLVYHSYMLKIAKSMSENDYKATVLLCKEALDELDKLPILDIMAVSGISLQLIASCTQLKRYEEAKAAIEKCFSIIPEGRQNWFKTLELNMTLCFHTRRYDEAWTVFKKATSHKDFAKIPKHWQETWKIFEAWLWFLKGAGQIKADTKEIKAFKASRFLNEVPEFSKDKRGMNVPIIVIQLATALFEKKYDIVMDRVEALSKYKSRYLDRDNNFRSSCFIRMVMEMEKQRFRRKQTIMHGEKLLADLSSSPIDITDQSYDIEILPLEDTWEFITSLLPEKGF